MVYIIFLKGLKKLQKPKKTKTVYREVSVESSTGEVLGETEIKRYPAEPQFVKIYFDGPLHILDKVRLPVVLEMARRMTYSGDKVLGNYVSIASPFGEKVAGELGVSLVSVHRIVGDLVKAGVIRRVGKGQYQVNPWLFGKGDWQSVLKLRESWPLK